MSLISFITHTFCPCFFPQRCQEAREDSLPLLRLRKVPTDSLVLQRTQPPRLTTHSAVAHKKIIDNLVSRAKYVKRPESLLVPERRFSIVAEDDFGTEGNYPLKKITLKNFNEPLKTGSTFEGVCQDLAFSVGKALEESSLGKDYELEVATGFCPQYFQGGTHFFILATPKNPSAVTTGSILIDPSFKKIIENYRDTGANPAKYSVSKRWKLDDFYKHRGKLDFSFKLLKPICGSELPPPVSCIPLGYVKDIIPELIKDKDPRGAMLYLTFRISPEDRETVQVSPSIQRHSHAAPHPMPDALLTGLGNEHPFVRLLAKIKADLHPPKRLRRSHAMFFNLSGQH